MVFNVLHASWPSSSSVKMCEFMLSNCQYLHMQVLCVCVCVCVCVFVYMHVCICTFVCVCVNNESSGFAFFLNSAAIYLCLLYLLPTLSPPSWMDTGVLHPAGTHTCSLTPHLQDVPIGPVPCLDWGAVQGFQLLYPGFSVP